ncbi:MAG: diguanylate cyclase (GGDEF)-like protein/PAS domain S-box-containing protein [Colwellia sp.]|jgi:diguanylate cyclase (GGDEF)-like protein/PAS domain S-box-containing protein
MNNPTQPTKRLAKLSPQELREFAEIQVKKNKDNKQAALNEASGQKLLHELQVHQIELEMINDELQQARITEQLHYRYTELFEFAPIAYFVFDLRGKITQVNLRGVNLLGVERVHLVGKSFVNYITIPHRNNFKDCLAKVFQHEGIQSFEILVHVNNTTRWLSIEANLGITGIDCLAALIDVTEKKQAENDQKLAASVFTYAREGIMITDNKSNIIDVNDSFTRITGYGREEAIGQNPRFLQSSKETPEFFYGIYQALKKEGNWSGEIWNRRKNGEVYAEMATISAVCNEHGTPTHYIALVNDITPMKEHQNQLEKIAHYDVLTNLPNRVLLADRLSQAMLQCSRHKHLLAVVFLDLDGFKAVNDTHSHDVGDKVLIALSIRMKEALREGDTLARIGGDEFVAILTDLDKVEDCEPVLERLLLAASEPVTVNNVIFHLSASIGITIYPQDNANTDQLVRHADQAMYVAKRSGKNCYHLFDTAQDDAVKMHQVNLEAIRTALDHHQFVLHYQPKVNMKTGIVIGVEALIRWQHPKKGLLNPIDFLPIIEHNPMNVEVGEWVINTALTQLSKWQKMGLNLLNISVNIAAVQLQQSSFTQTLSSLLAAHPDVNPHCLELEVLETSALDDIQYISNIMNDCIALGVNFALDDFGTGYSSLTYLRRLPASMIKIDQSFVQDMLVDVEDLAIVESVIALAKSFKRGVIAEGVESVEHCRTLLKLGCELAQGNGIAKPMPAGDIPAWVNHWQPDVSWQTQ